MSLVAIGGRPEKIDCQKGYDSECTEAKTKNVSSIGTSDRTSWKVVGSGSSDLYPSDTAHIIIHSRYSPFILDESDILLEKESLVLCSVLLACFALHNGLVQVTTEERSVP